MTNSVTVFGTLSFRSAIMGYVQMLGFALSQSWSQMISTLISSVVLMSTSTTAHECGGIFTFFSVILMIWMVIAILLFLQ